MVVNGGYLIYIYHKDWMDMEMWIFSFDSLGVRPHRHHRHHRHEVWLCVLESEDDRKTRLLHMWERKGRGIVES